MRNSSAFSWTRWLIVLALLGGGGFAGHRYLLRPAAAPVSFRTEAVTRGDLVQSVTANGSLTPVRLVEVGSQISGVITEIKADFNSVVKEGEVIAQIDPATYERALGQAEAELANSEAARELAKLNFDRASELLNNSLISKSEFDQARVNLQQAEANVKTRQANVDRARVDLSRTTIYAPMDGIVISRKVEAGQTVAASMNAPTLFIMANDLAKMRIEAAVSEADVGGVAEGQSVQFDVDAFPGKAFHGKVEQVRYAPTTNQNVVSYTTVVSADNRDLKLRPGMTANAKIVTSERRGVVLVPNAALRFRPPEGAIVKKDAAAAAAPDSKPAVALIESGPFAGLPEMPWMAEGGFRRPSEEERAAYARTLTPEQKQKYEQIMAQMRARFAQGGGQGGGGGFGGGEGGSGMGGGGSRRRAESSEGPKTATVYVAEKEALSAGGEQTVLKPVTVKVGITDGASSEVMEGLKEGDVVVVGTVTVAAAPAASNPLNPFSRPRR